MALPKLAIGANVAFNWLWSWWSWFVGYSGAIGVAIIPDIGFRFNIKSVPGFFVAPGIKFPLVVGRGFSFGVTGYVGLGYAFN